ncbi:MAG: transposase [Rhizonema sp. PD38]|nr:transposase [Rhizonema sp. PD38]
MIASPKGRRLANAVEKQSLPGGYSPRRALLFNQVLADFAREFKLGQDKHIILTLDRAGWHTSKDLEISVGLHLEYLPPYSPELQPAERLWPLVNEQGANRSFNTLED